jgi:hypothetical protein
LTGYNLRLSKSITQQSAGQGYGIVIDGTIDNTVTSSAQLFRTFETTTASVNYTDIAHYVAALNTQLGNLTNRLGFVASSTLGTGAATNVYGFFGGIAAATGRWNLYMNGTALNYFNGSLLIGSATDSGEKLQVTGTAKITSKLSMGAGTTSNAQINLASSTAPTSPNNGDIWFDGTDLKMRIGGVTKTFTLI